MKKLLLSLLIFACSNFIVGNIYGNSFNDPEFDSALDWMHNNGLTKYKDSESFIPFATLTREQASKFFSNFAITVLNQTGNRELDCSFDDIADADQSLVDSIVKSCTLGLFKGSGGKFMPKQPLTKAQALTVLIRTLSGSLDENIDPWWYNYFVKAGQMNITKESDVMALDRGVTRYEISLMLYRSRELDNSGSNDSEITGEIQQFEMISGNGQAQNVNEFGINIFKGIFATGENIMISPASISLALGMTYNGADNETKKAFENTMKLSSKNIDKNNEGLRYLIANLMNLNDEIELSVANSIWFDDYDTNQDFIDTNKKYFDAEINETLNLVKINDWVAEKTKDKIKKILNKLPPRTRMILLNAIYFKGKWMYPFDKEDTDIIDFELIDSDPEGVDMMWQMGEFNYFEDENVQLVELPYGSGGSSMILFLPSTGSNLKEFVDGISKTKLENYISQMTKSEGQIFVPKFKFEYEKSLNDILKKLGLADAFDGTKADFSKISSKGLKDLFIGLVKHKTYIEVNEEGTEAAAVTAVVMMDAIMGPDETFFMKINRPFFYIIKENQEDNIIFMGTVYDPRK